MKSPLEDVHIPTHSGLPVVVMDQMEKYGSRTALIDALTGRCLTFSELRHAVIKLSSALCAQGLCKDQLVLIACHNTIEFPIVFFAVTYLGGIISCINPQAKKGELERQILDCRPDYVVAGSADVSDKVKLIMEEHEDLKIKRIFFMGTNEQQQVTHGNHLHEMLNASDICHHQHTVDVKHQVAVLLYSSGTTGLPKGVKLTHYNLLANVFQISNPVFRSPLGVSNRPDTMIAVLPFFHIYGLTILQLWCLFTGSTMVVLPRFSFVSFLDAIEKYKVTYIHLVPPIAIQLIRDPVVDKYDLSSVTSVFSGAAPLGVSLCEQIKQRLHISDVRQGYGMTECSPGVLHPPLGHTKLESVGIPLPNTEVKVVDVETNEGLGPYQKGELWIRGPQVTIGYHNCETSSVDKNGWFRSGDIGYYDEGGFFFIVGRLKDIIKVKCYQVSPGEIEAILLNHPAVADAAVVGVADEMAGELPKAYVVLKPKCSPSSADIMQHVAAELSSYKQLRAGVEFVEYIPRSPSGKILRRILQQQAKHDHKSKL